jgi:hypothetical protein
MATAAAASELWRVEHGISIGSHNNTASNNKSIRRGLAYHRRVYKALRDWRPADQQLLIEPWLRCQRTRKLRQPDAILRDHLSNTAIVIEVKMNWKDGRDEKLINEYLEAAKSALGVEQTWPALITSNVRGYRGQPLLGLGALLDCCSWVPGDLTPVVLLP